MPRKNSCPQNTIELSEMMAATNMTRRPTADVSSDIIKFKPDGAVGGKRSPENNL